MCHRVGGDVYFTGQRIEVITAPGQLIIRVVMQ
jgi:hypothetical protein